MDDIEGVGELVRVETDALRMGVAFTALPSYPKTILERVVARRTARESGG